MIAQFRSRQFVLFLLTGGTAAAVNFLSRVAYSVWLSFSTAVILAYLTGMVTAFVLARLFVFKQSAHSVQRSAFFFVLVNLVAVLQTWAISMGLAYYGLPALGVTQWVTEIAHAIGVVVPVFTSYLGHKHWSFRSTTQ
jgi:putative flippase GtrA